MIALYRGHETLLRYMIYIGNGLLCGQIIQYARRWSAAVSTLAVCGATKEAAE